MIEKGAVFPMFYLPPVEYFVKVNTYKPVILVEKEEHFPKQTYRNRAYISSPDGKLALTVPVVKGSKNHTVIRDVKISYDFNWQRLHWQSLQTCYRRSAYFEYYEDEFSKFYEKKYDFLFDYNEELLRFILKAIKLQVEIKFTDRYETGHTELDDLRNAMSPKKNIKFSQKAYYQVFEERHGFLKNLSIADLLFNQGPHAVNYL